MNDLTRRARRAAIGLLVVGSLTVALASPTHAVHVEVRTTVPHEARVGDSVRIPLDMRAADGTALSGSTVIFYLRASFAGVTGEAEIGRAVTDETGDATLAYRPRLAGKHELRMEYVATGDSEVEGVSTAFDVFGGEQLHRAPPGMDVPGLNVGLLMAVLTSVWSILFGVALLLVRIARAGAEVRAPGGP